MDTLQEIFMTGSNLIVGLILLAILSLIIVAVTFYIIDVTQTTHAIRRNYPIIGRFRYFFEHLGEFFRQYFFAMDREELPFNRAQRSWVYRSAKNLDSTIAFGSTRNLNPPGTVLFVNCPFPTLEADAVDPQPITIGPYCKQPYITSGIFHISGMSYGAISKPAVQALSHGAKQAGCWMNTGEGGLSPYHLESGCDLVFQIGTAKYGVRDEHGSLSDEKLKIIADHSQVKMIEIKMSQGAKPGKGGILPAVKVTAEIAAIRGIPEGQSSISPNGHPDIKSVADLLDMIEHIRSVTGKPVGFKAVIGAYGWLDQLFALINERGIETAPDFITIDSADGGTGAAPMSLMDYMGLPLKESLPLVVDKLSEYGLRDRVKVIASGKLINAADVAWALCLGADFVTSARGFMFALGCIQALQCNKNTCPTGITTHNPRLQKGLVVIDKTTRVANYVRNMTHYVGVIAHSCGVKEPRQLKRYHARIVTDNGLSIPLDQLHPNIIATDKTTT
ncbi:FMN-binding glutamate synthase family protein [Spartinivicinus poritis]|uniref:FMN-binding glutamate synthase family protein n=1 Tax=Spartinivicinus poritis TaxID=2994640 RepID=A0ABT5U5F8_9GAMM|nr:FMN-binding glutamate synthase family protein [Spartinivicinus sp. A2-2]MDE1461236.1 FMN-binding glutamate synthase family protein [Spartinivicinus sp. A2-2]